MIIAWMSLTLLVCGVDLKQPIDWTYQVDPKTASVGECVTFHARRNFPGYNESSTTIVWRKDSKVIQTVDDVHVNGMKLYLSYVRLKDAAYYQVIVEDKVNKLRETTDFWLNVNDCKENEVEVPGKTGKCKESCLEMCPSGWHYVSGVQHRCYKYYGSKRSWREAEDECQLLGGQLAAIENSIENEFVGNLLQTGDGAWIGLNDRIKESSYVWNFNRKNVATYYSWGISQPDNDNSQCNHKNCIEMALNGYWSDQNCLMYRPFVCQKSSSSKDKNGWKCNDGKCLRYFPAVQQWTDALKICEKEGGKLVEIFTDDDNAMIRGLLESNAWIGLNDRHEAGLYVWNGKSALGPEATYFNWASGQPSDMMYFENSNVECKGEDCVQMRVRNSRTIWHDIDCSKKIPYVCERLRDSHLTTGAIVGITIGSMIGLSIIAGLIHELLRRRNKSSVRKMIQSAYLQDYSEMREKEFSLRRKSLWKVALRWKRPSRVWPAPS